MARRRLSSIQSFLDGFNGTYQTARQVILDSEMRKIDQASPTTTDGYSAADGQQLEAIANAKDEQGNAYYTVGTDAQGRYTVTPNQGGAGGEAGTPVQMPTRQRTEFLGQTYDKPPSQEEMSMARTMASAGVLRRYGDPRGALQLEQQAQAGQREAQRFALDLRRAEREDRAGAQREADEQQLRAIDADVADWSGKRLVNADGSAREATPDDQLAAGQYRVAKLIGAGRLSDANALAKDNMQLAASKIQLQTAERNDALARTAAAVAAGDLSGLEKFYETYVPDGANITAVTQDPKSGKITIERQTLDGRPLPPKVVGSVNEILAGLKTFEDPMALYNFSQAEFARNLQVKADRRADATAGASIAHMNAQTAATKQQMAVTAATGARAQPPSGYRWKNDGSGTLEAIPGGPGDKANAGKPMPDSAAKGLLENQVNLRRAQNALALINGQKVGDAVGDPEATGAKGWLPNQILNRLDPEGVDTRGAIADLGSLVIHDRSGAAVTAAEFPRLAPFIPTEKDDAETVKKKLNSFVKNYQAQIDDTAEFYKAMGYKVPTETLKPGAAALPAGGAQQGGFGSLWR